MMHSRHKGLALALVAAMALAALWTRSPEGRIIQVAFGHLEDGSADGFKKFTVDDTIGTTTSPTGAASQ